LSKRNPSFFYKWKDKPMDQLTRKPASKPAEKAADETEQPMLRGAYHNHDEQEQSR
jgi:hypothetical protein